MDPQVAVYLQELERRIAELRDDMNSDLRLVNDRLSSLEHQER